jgi:REase_MTES_1575
MAALLWAEENSALAYRAAGAYWAFDGARPGWVEIFTPTRQASPAAWLILHNNQSLPADEVRKMGPLLVTSPARTLLDLGAVISPRQVEHALEDAVRRKLTNFVELNDILLRHAASGRNGVGVLRELLEDRSPSDVDQHSRFERRMLRLMKNAGLPVPERQHLVFDSDGYPFAQIDLAYPEIKLGIECDSYTFHSGREAWEADLARRNKLTLMGWYIIHVTWRQLTTCPYKVLAEIRKGLLICNKGS